MIRYSIVLPAYNEEKEIRDTIVKITEFFENRQEQIEILVVDDGSMDATVRTVESIGYDIRILKNTRNLGKGESVRRGILASKGEYILFSDVDLSVPLSFFPTMLETLANGVDVVIASRRHHGSRIVVPQSSLRAGMGILFNTLVRFTLLPGMHDTQCGLKGFTRNSASEIFKRISVTGWCFDVEALVIAKELGYTVEEISVDWYNSTVSKVRPLHTLFQICRDLPKILMKRRIGKYR